MQTIFLLTFILSPILTIHYETILFAAVDDDFLLSPLKYPRLHLYLAIPVMRKQLII
jgi:hypothetical protein